MQAGQVLRRQLQAEEGPRPDQAVAECLSALNALESMGVWPGPSDPITEQGIREVRERWARIQRRARAQALRDQISQLMAKATAEAIARFQADVVGIARNAIRAAMLGAAGEAAARRRSVPRSTRRSPARRGQR